MGQEQKQKYDYPFRNPNLSLEDRVKDLVSRLTLEEKAGLVSSRQKGIKRLGVSEWYVGCEVARGYVGRSEEEPSTVLPQPIGMAAMFDPELMYQLGELAGNEARVYYQNGKKGKLMLWGPTVDMERDPRWGRTEEAYGEDPFLTGQMTIQYTKGLRGEDPYYLRTVPTLKHFCANNNEVDRDSCSANLEPRTKHEYYYKAFEPSITEGGAMSMMAAYNEISGVPAVLNPDLKRVVKDTWGLDFIVSDGADFSQTVTHHNYVSNHAESVALALHAGTDIMTDDADLVQASVLEAMEHNYITESELDESISRVLTMRFRLGEFDPDDINPYANIPASIVNCEAYKQLNNKAAKEQMILLKNNGILPLKKEKANKVAVIGPLGNKNYMDWYTGYSNYNLSILDGLKELLGKNKVVFDNAYNQIALKSKVTGKYIRVKDDNTLMADGNNIGLNETFEYHDWDYGVSNLLSLKNNKFLREDETITASGENTYGWFVKEGLNCKELKSINIPDTICIDTWMEHQLLTDHDGKIISCQKSRMTDNKQFIKETISDGIERAVELAKNSDIAIVCVGNDPLQVARECFDRPDIALPQHQSDLIKAVYEANPNTIVVIVSSYPYAINWENENIPAIVYTTHAGPELGHAISEVLFGTYNPAGRTPLTWYKSIDDLPNIMDYDIIKNNVTYLYYDGEPLYPFGYGLSYSTFEYNDLNTTVVDTGNIKLKINVDVMNTSNIGGDEVVQLYFSINDPRIKRPIKQLCGFKRIFIPAGGKKTITFEVKEKYLEFYDVTRERFCVESGDYTFMVGSSSKDIRLEKTIHIDGETIPPQTLRKTTPIINYDDKSGVKMYFSKEKNMHYVSTFGMENHFVKFGDVLFDGCTAIEITAATAVGKGMIHFYIDELGNNCIGSLEVLITGGPDRFKIQNSELIKTEGIHDFYIVLSEGVSLLNLKLL